jgi:hypothetical protein
VYLYAERLFNLLLAGPAKRDRVVESASKIGPTRGWARRSVEKVGDKWGKVGDAGTDGIPIRCTSDKNTFTLLRAGARYIGI